MRKISKTLSIFVLMVAFVLTFSALNGYSQTGYAEGDPQDGSADKKTDGKDEKGSGPVIISLPIPPFGTIVIPLS